MTTVEFFIHSGIIEQYVFGLTNDEESREVVEMATRYKEVEDVIAEVSNNLEDFARTHAITPPPDVKPLFLATINYMERMQKGEVPCEAPLLNQHSTISDFEKWLSNPVFTSPGEIEDLYARIITYTPTVLTAVVWIKTMAPVEVHDDEYERFLIVEGSCTITVNEKVYNLRPGDYFGVPLHANHHIQVTSAQPCKAILQRVAA